MAKDAVNKDKAMASHLKAIGIPHGRRTTATHCPPDPTTHKFPGSAAYRRIMAQKEQRFSFRDAAKARRDSR